MLTISDGGGVQEPLILIDVICEQPLIALLKKLHYCIVKKLHCCIIAMFKSIATKLYTWQVLLGDHFRKISEIFLPGS